MVCPVNRRRAVMTDDEYWEDVAASLQDKPFDPDPEDEDLSDKPTYPTPCEACGEVGPCAYDTEGRALIHADSLRTGE